MTRGIRDAPLKSMTRQERKDKIMVERRRKGRLNEGDESGDRGKRGRAKGRKGEGKRGKVRKWKIEILSKGLGETKRISENNINGRKKGKI